MKRIITPIMLIATLFIVSGCIQIIQNPSPNQETSATKEIELQANNVLNTEAKLKECTAYNKETGKTWSMWQTCENIVDCNEWVEYLTYGEEKGDETLRCEDVNFVKAKNIDGSYISCNTNKDCWEQLGVGESIREKVNRESEVSYAKILDGTRDLIGCSNNLCAMSSGLNNLKEDAGSFTQFIDID